jgi:EAL domain-containing protein (putative c-di-GMP-specific phosphodiesterase class I)
VLGALKDIGVTLALDEFGTGYSSLTHLRRFPVDRLKIDRSFIEGLGRERGDDTIVRAVVELAGRLGMEAVAEGVETPEQHDAVVRLGCTRAQGLYYGRATDSRDFGRMVEKPPPLRSIALSA